MKSVQLNGGRLIAGALLMLVLHGCAHQGYSNAETTLSGSCMMLWQHYQQQVSIDNAFDAQDWPLPAYPYLRIDRAMGYRAQDDLSPLQRTAWLGLAYDLGQKARRIEFGRLSLPMNLLEMESCLQNQVLKLRDDAEFWRYVLDHPRPDAYENWRYWLGLQPLFKPYVRSRVRDYNHEVKTVFQYYEQQHPWLAYDVGGRASMQSITSILNPATHQDALGFPQFSQAETESLLTYYSPVIELEHGHPDDRIGRPQKNKGHWQVDDQAKVFTLQTHTHWQGQWLPQLVYLWWYPSRPKTQALDIYGGELDGLMFRVTLNWQGEVLFYDSIHPCGCYQKIFPIHPKIVFNGSPENEEPLLVLPVTAPSQPYRPVLRLNSIQHYVVGLHFDTGVNAPAATHYQLLPYTQLTSARLGEAYLFGPEGLVSGSERLERFFLWNMGVVSPGAMRQWGHHATAFASRRHFDDPTLFERYFSWNDSDGYSL